MRRTGVALTIAAGLLAGCTAGPSRTARLRDPPDRVTARTGAGEVVVTPQAGVADPCAAPGPMSNPRTPPVPAGEC